MAPSRIEDIPDRHRRHGAGSRLWAEWCFLRVCLRHFRGRILLLVLILLTGALLFRVLEPDKRHSLAEATWCTFSLIFGEPPEEFPKPVLLQVLFFLVPILGLAVIIEGIIDFSLIIRDRRRFERSWCVMLASSFKDHIVIVGLGKLGYRTFTILRRLGEAVVVIEQDEENRFLADVRADGSPLVIGDARREALLEEVNIAQARAIILGTDDDLANLEIALDARKINPEIRVVMRMFDQNTADKVKEGLNINLAMSQSAISAPTFATCALAPSTVNSFILGDRIVAMQRWLVRAGCPLDGKTVAEAMSACKVNVVEHQRPGAAPELCPDPGTRLAPGDGLLLQGPVDTLAELRRIGLERVKVQS